MTAPATLPKAIRLDLDSREAFLLNSIYAIGLMVTAGDSKAAQLVDAVKSIVSGDKGGAALFRLSDKMQACAAAITREDGERMARDP